MYKLNLAGGAGKVVFSRSKKSDGETSTRYMTLSPSAGLAFFRKNAILRSDILKNAIGLYSFAKIGANGRTKFMELTAPKHLLSKHKSGCTWDPKGRISMTSDEITACRVSYEGEQCPDEFYGTCLDSIYGNGNKAKDFFATKEGQALFNELIRLIYAGLGNSYFDLAWYAQHPLIIESGEKDWYTTNTPDLEWDDYYDQMIGTCESGGFITMVDSLKQAGLPHYNVTIDSNDITPDGKQYKGRASDLFDRLLNARPSAMKKAAKSRAVSGRPRFNGTLILVDPRIFNKYKRDLQLEFKTVPAMLYFYLNGDFCKAAGCDNKAPVDGALMYDGALIVSMDEFSEFNDIIGTNIWRAMAVTPGNFGLLYEEKIASQFGGFGLEITQHLDAPYKGKVFMSTTFQIGMGLVSTDHTVNASLDLVPKG